MDKGKIIEQGTHRELIDLGGKYAYLVKQQSLEENIVMEGGDAV
jgi:ABC-type multidrug transport system fused ATPase/permease subunit